MRATVLIGTKDLAAARADLDRAVALSPDHAPARALALSQVGDFVAAQAALDIALALNPWLPERHFAERMAGPAA